MKSGRLKRFLVILFIYAVIATHAYSQSITKIGWSDATSNNNWTELVVTSDGKLWVGAQNYYDLIAAGKIDDHFALHKFGHNDAVGTTEEVIWTAGNGYTYLSAAETLQVSSSDADDDGSPAGTGARTILICGLDTNWAELEETVILNGTTSVETTNSFLRVFRSYVITAGSSQTNEGLISIKDNADVVQLAEIVANKGQTEMAMWTVPADNTFFITRTYASESNNKKVTISLYTRDNTITNPAWRLRGENIVNLSDITATLSVPIEITEKVDIELRATAATAGGDVQGGFEGYYEL
jgi:hypothetical protein